MPPAGPPPAGVPEPLAWQAIDAYFQRYGLLRHQIEAFDHFTMHLLPHIIRESADLRVRHDAREEEHVVSIANVGLNRPVAVEADGSEHELMPHMARLRGLSYCSNVVVDVVHDIHVRGRHEERRVYREVTLCSLPVMVGSQCCHSTVKPAVNECRLDPGGYFVINGVEKALIAQERLRTNVPFIFALKGKGKHQLCCEIRSCAESKLRSTSTLCVYITAAKNGAMPEMVAVLPFMQSVSIPVLAVFRLLRVETRAEAVSLIVGDDEDAPEMRLLCSILDNDMTAGMTTADIFEWLGREATTEPTRERRQRFLDHIVSSELLPHMGLANEPAVLRAKAAYLGFMVRKLIRVYTGELQPDDRDHYAGKRVDPSGMGLLFRQLYRSVLKSASAQMARLRDANKLRYANVSLLIGTKRITNAFRYAFSTGTWSAQSTKSSPTQTGVVQMISRMSVLATISNMRRVNTPISRETKAPKPRMLHSTSWGLLCPKETPEGTACGLIKALAMLAHVRVGAPSEAIEAQLRQACHPAHLRLLDEVDGATRARGVPVLVNGMLVGYAPTRADADAVLARMREARARQAVPFDTTVARYDGAVVVDSDPGCLLRPLFRGDRMHRAAAVMARCASMHDVWDALVREGVVVYVDKTEEASLRVGLWAAAPSPDAYTHYEIHPACVNGICAAMIPFPDHNQSPRNTYQSAMCKQSMGVFAFNHARRMDTVAHVLCDPERPLVSTRFDAMLHVSDAPSGVNIVVAIMCQRGYNQEDSVILNRAAVERGLFRSVKYTTYRDEEHVTGADSERFENPSTLAECTGLRVGNYASLDRGGVAPVGRVVRGGDVVIGKTVATSSAEATLKGHRVTVKRDKSVLVKGGDHGVVDAVLRSHKPDGSRIVKVKTRDTRSPLVGDKFSSRMGQKGVVGTLLAQEDMPYTADGVTPDLIVNPHAIPSRMTIGMLLETLLGRVCAVHGEQGDATPFCGTTVEDVAEALRREGFDGFGNEVMYDGCTGERYETTVFLGPTYYQRLKHMSADKIHARSRGPKQVLTHQPIEGRARDGGLRFGEMERDCVIAHGNSHLLRERLMINSDGFPVWLCTACGNLALPAAKNAYVRHSQPFCGTCESPRHVVRHFMPYACKLLLQELGGMGVNVNLLGA